MEQKSGLKHFGGFWGFLKRGFSSGPAHFLTKNVPGACCSWRIVATSSVGATFDRAASRLRGPD